jgi:hypothetical protein
MIIRSTHRDRYVIISKVPLEDMRLSWRSRGLHAYLLSKPDGWIVMVAHLVKQSPDGKATVMACLKELEGYGYIVRKPKPRVSGRFSTAPCYVYEEPQEIPDDTTSELQPGHHVRITAAVKQPLVINEVVNDDEVKKESNVVDLDTVRKRNREILKGLQ